MAPFLVHHPKLFNARIMALETALARVRAVESAEPGRVERFRGLLDRAICHAGQWNTDDVRQMTCIETMRRELAELRGVTFSTVNLEERLHVAFANGVSVDDETWRSIAAVAARVLVPASTGSRGRRQRCQ
ncbi:MAG: hypothetical protein ACREIB_03375 [Pseudomonadota bacterium]